MLSILVLVSAPLLLAAILLVGRTPAQRWTARPQTPSGGAGARRRLIARHERGGR
ncbi:hypothetical protein [Kitasatospora sp. NBC_00315]|uniref:hypothetical protein n=1 Tax=Kitasatospora sp. NBC_00315 TaxID=2975963 RepID=UPI00324CEB25